jgi:O-antigen ligase
LHQWALAISGYQFDTTMSGSAEDLFRFGIIRASGPFGHPILLGTAMAYGLVFTYALKGTFRVFCCVGCAIGLVASFSSAPMLGFVLAVVLAVYGKLVQFKGRWFTLFIVAFGLFMLFVMLHPAPFGWLLGHFLLNAHTGNYRLLIWQYAGEGVLASPIVGMGLIDPYPTRPAWMAQTVDSIWLMSAMQFGIPGSLLIASSIVSACWPTTVARADRGDSVVGVAEDRMAKCLSMNIFVVIFLGFTVHFWGTSWILLGLMAGLRASFSQFLNGVRRQFH